MNTIVFDQVLGNIGWKDTQLRHLGCNINLANTLKLRSPEEIVGLKDNDLPTHTEHDSQLHYQNDQLALQGKTVNLVHRYHEKFYFITKKSLRDINKNITGIIYHCQELENPDFFFQLNRNDKKYVPANKVPSYYKIQSDHNPFNLSRREQQCVFHILRGKTTKQIAEVLNLSKRTVDFYIENIKNKIGCRTKSELLVAAIESGYMNIIPLNTPQQ